ncbi:hypothetical protein MKEN_00538700 [Mycena kentingensis (nom. inval.)]|nr:hypothetical protein MKEN_00538700 [Mycena kentingensis (nom. inval.)]
MKLSTGIFVFAALSAQGTLAAPTPLYRRENGVALALGRRFDRAIAPVSGNTESPAKANKAVPQVKKVGPGATSENPLNVPVPARKKSVAAAEPGLSTEKTILSGSEVTADDVPTLEFSPELESIFCPIPQRKSKTVVGRFLEYVGVVEARAASPAACSVPNDVAASSSTPATTEEVDCKSTSSKLAAACKAKLKKVASKISGTNSKLMTVCHATCRARAQAIEKQMESANAPLKLATNLKWPNEFSFWGGFYATTSKDKAELFGAHFRDCRQEGGHVVMKFTLNREKLRVTELGDGDEALTFWSEQLFIGERISNRIAALPGRGKVPVGTPRPRPSAQELEMIIAKDDVFDLRPAEDTRLRGVLDAFRGPEGPDVVTGAVLEPGNVAKTVKNVKFGLEPIESAIPQVVLVTDRAMAALKLEKFVPIDADREAASMKVFEALDVRLAAQEAARQAAGAS